MKKLITLILVAFLIGCAPMTQKAIDLKEARMYEQWDREDWFEVYSENCLAAGNNVVKIERWGNATRNQVVRNVPGRGDKVYCIKRQYI